MVVGDAMLDRYWLGSINRKASEKDIPIVSIDTIVDELGGSASVAVKAAALGMRVHLMGSVGQDLAGRRIKTLCHRSGIEWHGQIVDKTIVKTRMMSGDEVISRADQDVDLSGKENRLLLEAQTIMPQCDVLIIADYNKGTVNDYQAWINWANKIGCPVFVDTKKASWVSYEGATMIKPNADELLKVSHAKSMAEAISMIPDLKERYHIPLVWLTLAKDGMQWHGHDEVISLTSKVKSVVDVTGAGDASMAMMAALWGDEQTIKQRLSWANLASATAVSYPRNQSIGWSEIKDYIS